MICNLKIQNIVLVDLAEIQFGKGLNIITGETGAGKSAILSAIRLIMGERADTLLIGGRGDLGVVEAKINDSTFVRREIHRSGRSRAFINDELVTLTELREQVGSSIELIDQSSSHLLSSLEEQRKILDGFAGISEEVKRFSLSFAEEKEIEKKLSSLLALEPSKERELAWAQEDFALMEKVSWKEGEEEDLLRQHDILACTQDMKESIAEAASLLEKNQLKKAVFVLEKLAHKNAAFHIFAEQTKEAYLLTEEVGKSLFSHLHSLDGDPLKLTHIEDRLSQIQAVQKRFGKTFAAMQSKRKELQEKIAFLESLEENIQALQKELSRKQQDNEMLAQKIMSARRAAASSFSALIEKEIAHLNLPHAKFFITVDSAPRHSQGADQVGFRFSANLGFPPAAIEECASGGELSRLFLAMKTILAEKNKSCLIFDEIDGNVGGQTATVLGEKLSLIAKVKQVICITHFVQVAKLGAVHFGVVKLEEEGKTRTQITRLKDVERILEYERMIGSNREGVAKKSLNT